MRRPEVLIGAAQHRTHARHHFVRIERFGDVIVGAEIQPHHTIFAFHAGGQHHDWGGGQRGIAPHDARDVPAVAIGQHQIEHHQIGPIAANGMQRCFSLVSRRYVIAGLFQIGANDADNFFIVVDDQNTLTHGDALPSSGVFTHKHTMKLCRNYGGPEKQFTPAAACSGREVGTASACDLTETLWPTC
jgi:hypothetical protein